LVRDVHERAGHFGVRKTLSLLKPHYWWVGLATDVAQEVRRCGACDRVKASFNAKHPTLQPLPIKGLFYRWGLDFAGPLPKSQQGHQYVLVMVEHFSKQIILVATKDKEPSTVAAAFTREVLTRFGACAEVVTDRGGEFGGEFQACLDAAFIDHRATSAHHPHTNGLSERVVGIVKRLLRKWCLGHASEEWDAYLPWVAMGYNFSAQASLAGFSPYQLLFGREPVVPGAIKVALEEALDLDEPERLAALVAQRAVLFQRWMPMAMGNLEIAQHRDTLRYAKTCSGAWKPRLVQYAVGDYVYLQREMLDTLDTRAGASVLRVRAVAENGVLELEGSDARTVRVHMERCAPYHRPDVDGRMDPRTAVPTLDFACTRCRKASGAARMLMCDGCGAGWHLECLARPLSAVPEGDWYCGRCREGRADVALLGQA
jgi:transposase InsO family protein